MSDTEDISGRQAPAGGGEAVTLDEGKCAPPFHPGDTIGRYQIRDLLGAGGMGVVYTALDPELGRTVALKLLHPGRRASARARTRLLREAQALARLQHPNVVTVHDVGVDGEHVFLAMELIDGPTLCAWLDAEPRSWPAIRDVFVAAGRGLAAAHAASIVHRDFKPHNVMVGADRVVVVDFGLALANGDSSGDDCVPSSVLDLNLTLTGERVGTPRYMAPEQHAGGIITARADQYSFATALCSALSEGHAPPRGRKVPARVHAALTRALAQRPEDRWPDLTDLLAELDREPPRKRHIGLAVAACAVLAAAASSYGVGRKNSVPDPCGGAEAVVANLWDDAARARTREAFRRTGRSYADDTFQRVDAALRQRLDGWAIAHRDACEATAVRHEQSPARLDARMACLGRARTDIAALVSLLPAADAAALDRATAAAENVGDFDVCTDPDAPRAAVPPPRDPAAVEALRSDIARLGALRLLGKVQEGLALAHEVVARARAADYAPVLAAALDDATWFEITAGHDDAAVALGYETARAAGAAGDDTRVAAALAGVAYVLGYDKQRFDAAEAAYQGAVAAAARVVNPGVLLERLYGDRQSILYQRGEYLTVLPLCQVVLALGVHLHGPASYQAALSLSELADAVRKLGDPAVADGMFRRALAIGEHALGPEHPIVLAILNNAGAGRLDVFDYDGATTYLVRALRAKEHVFGLDDPSVAIAAHNLGIARRGQRRLSEARALFERALRIRRDKLGPEHPLLATTYAELSEVAKLEGRDGEALADLERAIAIKRAAYGDRHPLLAASYRSYADLLLALGRPGDARAALAQAEQSAATATLGPRDRGEALRLAAALQLAVGDARGAEALYRQALALLESEHGHDGPGLLEPLLGLGAAQLAAGDAEAATATAGRAVAIAVAHAVAVDDQCAAQFLLARAEWSRGVERSRALALARATRARLAAAPYPTQMLAQIDRWLAAPRAELHSVSSNAKRRQVASSPL